MIRQITADEARPFFAHPSQRRNNLDPETLHDNGIEYWVNGPVCGMAHRSFWPGVWMVHYAVKPDALGRVDVLGRQILEKFWEERKPELITGWTDEKNRAAVALAKRVGFKVIGTMELPSGTVLMQEWRP